MTSTESAVALMAQRPRSLAMELVEALGGRVRDGRLKAGAKLPTEAQMMAEFGVSRTVVREALSRLQAAGTIRTRHGIGSFVLGAGLGSPFLVSPEQLDTLRDVLAVLELRIGVEFEAAVLAAFRRSAQNLALMRAALDELAAAVKAGQDAVAADWKFHIEVARATQNLHFVKVLESMGTGIIPRSRLDQEAPVNAARRAFLRRINAEHESILSAIDAQDAEAARSAMRKHLTNSSERRRQAALVQPSASDSG